MTQVSSSAQQKTWVEIISSQLNARQQWREITASNSNGIEDLPTDVDIFFLVSIAHFVGAKRLLVDSSDMVAPLKRCFADQAIEVGSIEQKALTSTDICLYSATASADKGAASAESSDAIVLIYGWGRRWQEGSFIGVVQSKSVSYLPLAGQSPGLWKSSLVLLVHEKQRAQVESFLASSMSLLGDRSLDPFFLLDQVQELRASLRRSSSDQDDITSLKARVHELERELTDLRRSAVLQQETLALLSHVQSQSTP
jgi:hypothetical protein